MFAIHPRWKVLLPLLFTLILMIVLVAFNKQKPKILVVNSSSLSESWTADVNKSMRDVFAQTTYPSIFWHSLGARTNWGLGDKQKSGIIARRTIDRMKPDVLVLVDDDAQELVGKYYINAPDIQIIYCGISGNLENYGYDDARNVSGIFSTLPLRALKDALPLFAPDKVKQDLRIILIGDTSWPSKWDKEKILAYDWAPLHLIDTVHAGTFDEWKESILKISDRADVILISNYGQILKHVGRPDFIDPQELIRWTMQNTSVPIVGLNGSIVQDGSRFALATSPYEQGETAAKMALSHISTNINHLNRRHLEAKDFLVYMRDEGGNALVLPPIYPAFARAVRKSFPAQDNQGQSKQSHPLGE